MPTEKEREYYEMGFADGIRAGRGIGPQFGIEASTPRRPRQLPATKRKLSAWNKFVKANAKKPRFKYRDGKLNLKKMGVAFRKTPAGRKKK